MFIFCMRHHGKSIEYGLSLKEEGNFAAKDKDDEGMSAAFSSTQQSRARGREVRKVEPKVILGRFLSRDSHTARPRHLIMSSHLPQAGF